MKREREKKGITLDEISVATKIGTRNLRAIEENEFNKLPGGIFNKGFVRAYARHLGMDEDQVVSEYLEASGEAKIVEEAQVQEVFPLNIVEKEDERQKAASWNVPWGVLAVALVVVALGFAVWGLYFGEGQAARVTAPRPTDAQTPPSPPVEQGLPSTQPATDTSAPTASPSATPAPGPTQSGSGAAVHAPSSTAPSGPAVQSASLASSSQLPTPTPASETAPADSTGTFDVAIRARQDSWLSITADGRVVMDGMLAAEHDTLVRAREKITVRAGNIAAVDVFFNGRLLTTQGEEGRVKVMTFGRTGLVSQ